MKKTFEDEIVSPQKHNWLYSVVPDLIAGGIYLVGYCKNDNKSFTVRLKQAHTINHVVIDNLDIPKYGCEPID